MAWGSSSKAPPPPRSALSKLLPLLIFLVVVGAFAFIGYQVYLVTQQVSKSASDKMAAKNVSFTKDGVKVGVKEMKNEIGLHINQGLDGERKLEMEMGTVERLKLGNHSPALLPPDKTPRAQRLAITPIYSLALVRNSSGVTANTGLLGKNWIWGWIGAFIRFCITAPFSFVLQDRRGSHKSLKGHTWWSKVIANNA
ncbi:hypothetical protein EYC84_009128 [Monilinia fructicola]|uniref:Uncharacterized protein n=1 Tax=Monilinia fructicola TaxID=38448 RepID=A0A5M9JBF5_MONFR|nr:hypothetical protein EYC84_009128 [Monilinia fructicola]